MYIALMELLAAASKEILRLPFSFPPTQPTRQMVPGSQNPMTEFLILMFLHMQEIFMPWLLIYLCIMTGNKAISLEVQWIQCYINYFFINVLSSLELVLGQTHKDLETPEINKYTKFIS